MANSSVLARTDLTKIHSTRMLLIWMLTSICFVLIFTLISNAQQIDSETKIDRHLDSGEFSPALRIAKQIENQQQRDALLEKIATAQKRAGALRASISTSSLIRNDTKRYKTISQSADLTQPLGAGGTNEASFDQIIELITSVVAPNSWQETGDGEGTIAGFDGGVYVDPAGVMRRILKRAPNTKLSKLLEDANPHSAPIGSVRTFNNLRKVSLTRLEKAVQEQILLGKKPTEAMSMLAGLEKIQYVFVYPDTGDIVIAGPASDWKTGAEGHVVSKKTGRPILLLDDLVEVFQHISKSKNSRFGCSITPTQQSLAKTRAFLKQSSKKAIKPAQRNRWLKQLRDTMGKQTIDIYGINPQSHVGKTLVEADYRMKLVGMGLENGVPGVNSYLSQVEVLDGKSPPPMSVLRWWFTLNYDSVLTTKSNMGFELKGPGVQVLSENELIKETGQRVHTGKSDPIAKNYARSFTKHFPELSKKYPVYAQLHNIFDLAMVATLIKTQNIDRKLGWEMNYFNQKNVIPIQPTPATVETVINHRVIKKKHIVAGVSGGVTVDTTTWFKDNKFKFEIGKRITARQNSSKPTFQGHENWWWD